MFVERFWKQDNMYPSDKDTNEIGEMSASKQPNPLYLQEKENK